MYNNILVPVALDHDIDVQSIIATARRLLAEHGKITLVAVVEDVPVYVAEYTTVKPAEHIRDDLKKNACGPWQKDSTTSRLRSWPASRAWRSPTLRRKLAPT